MHLGVVVGRFQVPDLHPAHHILIGEAMRATDQLLLILGVPHTRGTNNDPLDYATRRLMIQRHYPQANVIPLNDVASDLQWSRNLDAAIRTLIKEDDKVTLFCGRDGFNSAYRGKFPVKDIETVPTYSGTGLRVDARKAPRDSIDFRQGVIYGVGTKYPMTHMTVDIAVIGPKGILVARRPNANKLRFPGGFVDFADHSLEQSAHRELLQEMGLEAKSEAAFEYVASLPVDDWRYRGRPDQRIMTTLFAIREEDTVGEHTPDGEELEDFTYVSPDGGSLESMTEEHKPLYMALVRHLDGKEKGVSEGAKKTKRPKVKL